MADQLPLAGTAARRHRGPTESAAERTLAAWRADGHHPDPLTSSQLRGAAADVDRALDDYRHDRAGLFPLTRARAFLLTQHEAAAPASAGAADQDPLADIIARLMDTPADEPAV